MKTIAVIAECNPLHNGHAWFLQNCKAASGADHLIVLLSGDFVQRGEPAIFDKYLRAEMALLSGADLVLELPVAFATASASVFAEGAVSILHKLGVVEELWFGSEAGTSLPFYSLSEKMHSESDHFKAALRAQLAGGRSYPAAREAALLETLDLTADEQALLHGPNNILGLEYCLALARAGAPIRPCTLPRIGGGQASPFAGSTTRAASLSADGYSSATQLRSVLLSARADAVASLLAPHVPQQLLPFYRDRQIIESALCADDFSASLSYALWNRYTSDGTDGFSSCLDVSPDLANRIAQQLTVFRSFSAFADLLKTKDRTLSRIRRALLHILLGLCPADLEAARARSYVRMLGHTDQPALLHAIKEKGQLSLLAGGAALSQPSYQMDLWSSHLYESVRAMKSGNPFQSEFQRKLLTPAPR